MPKLFAASLLLLWASWGCQPAVPPEVAWTPEWEVQYSETTTYFWALSIVDTNTVWVAGTQGRVARTIDGGENWTVAQLPGAESLQFRDVHAFSDQVAFVLSIGNGPDSRIYRTSNGGASWELSFQNEDSNGFFDCLSFWDRERGVAFSDSYEGEFRLMRTQDGGASWQRIDPEKIPDARPGGGPSRLPALVW